MAKMTERKACKRCRRTKPLTAFPTMRDGRVMVTCTPCREDKQRRYRRAGQQIGEGHQLYYAHSMGNNPEFLKWNSISILPPPEVHPKHETPQEKCARKIEELELDIEQQVYNNMTKRANDDSGRETETTDQSTVAG